MAKRNTRLNMPSPICPSINSKIVEIRKHNAHVAIALSTCFLLGWRRPIV
jgi:hypothetical protein